MPLKHESLLAGAARPSRAHKWYSVLTGDASVNDLCINKESTAAWAGVRSPGRNPRQALALLGLDGWCSQWQHWQGAKQKLLSSESLSSTARDFLLVSKSSRWGDRNGEQSNSKNYLKIFLHTYRTVQSERFAIVLGTSGKATHCLQSSYILI